MTFDLDDISVLADGLDHPECVTWGPDGYVYAGGEAGQVHRVSLTGKIRTVGSTGGFVLGLCLDQHANIFTCDQGRHAIMRMTPSGETTVYSSGSGDQPLRVPNFAVFDPHGNLYVSDSGHWKGWDGCLFRVRPGGATEVLSRTNLAFPNGLALDANAKYLYVVLSNEARVVRYPLQENGMLGEMQQILALPHTVPDGLAFDAEGALLVSCYTPDIIYRYRQPDRLEVLIEDWEGTRIATPTNVCFAGPGLATLVIASLSRWHLATCRADTPGMPLNYPDLTQKGD